jgi:uncharacterized membrane protein YbhN (UPF0104 family)
LDIDLASPPSIADDAHPAGPPRANWKSWAGAAVGLLVLALAAWGLKKIAGQVTLAQVVAEVQSTPAHIVAAAATSVFFSYVVLIGYDWFATRHLGYKIRWRTLAAASFASFTMSHTLGVTLLTGGTVRYRIYTREGVKPVDIAMIILLCGWTFWLGIIFVAGVGLVAAPDLASPLRAWIPEGFEHLTGLVMLVGVAAYTVLTGVWKRDIKLWRIRFALPNMRDTFTQIFIGTIDLAFAGGALFLLLPDVPGAPQGFAGLLTFLAIYAVAMVSGAMSHAPGGLGVFELVIVALLPDMGKAEVLAAVALFRLLYTFIPFVLGVLVIVLLEGRALQKARAALPDDPPAGAANKR